MLFAEHRERRAEHGKDPFAAAGGKHGAQNPDRNQQLRTSNDTRDGFNVNGVPGEDDSRRCGSQWWKPASEQEHEQDRCEPVPRRVH